MRGGGGGKQALTRVEADGWQSRRPQQTHAWPPPRSRPRSPLPTPAFCPTPGPGGPHRPTQTGVSAPKPAQVLPPPAPGCPRRRPRPSPLRCRRRSPSLIRYRPASASPGPAPSLLIGRLRPASSSSRLPPRCPDRGPQLPAYSAAAPPLPPPPPPANPERGGGAGRDVAALRRSDVTWRLRAGKGQLGEALPGSAGLPPLRGPGSSLGNERGFGRNSAICFTPKKQGGCRMEKQPPAVWLWFFFPAIWPIFASKTSQRRYKPARPHLVEAL